MKVHNIIALTPTPILRRLPTKRLSRDLFAVGDGDRRNDDPHRGGEREGISLKVHA